MGHIDRYMAPKRRLVFDAEGGPRRRPGSQANRTCALALVESTMNTEESHGAIRVTVEDAVTMVQDVVDRSTSSTGVEP